MGAVLGQMANGGGSAHLEEQLSCVSVPSLTNTKHGTLVGYIPQVTSHGIIADYWTRRKTTAISNKSFNEEVPEITVVVDGGWTKRAPAQAFIMYNVKSGVSLIFGATTKKLLFIGIRNKYCSACSILLLLYNDQH